MNAFFARPGDEMVEMIGKIFPKAKDVPPTYCRNINMMLGHYYESIKGDHIGNHKDAYFNVDLEEDRIALVKTRDHAASWIEEHGHWR